MDKILVIGAAGMLRSQVVHQLQVRGEIAHEATREQIDIADEKSIESALTEINPDVVIN